MMDTTLSRRDFLKVSAVAGGGVLIGFCVGLPRGAAAQAAPPPSPNAFVKIDAAGGITVICPRNEMGQDVYTSLTQLLAEELGVDPMKVNVQQAPAHPAYVNRMLGGQITGGSTSVRDAWEPMRKAGAATRVMLVNAAATQWNVPAGECRAENGVVIHGNRRLSYGELAAAVAKMTPPADVALKSPAQFTVIGKNVPRLDGPGKARGTTVFGIDVVQKDMLYAALVQCPVLGGKVKSFDASAVEKRPGVRKVVNIGEGVAVVADHYWMARSALNDVKVEWDAGPAAKLDTAGIYQSLERGRENHKYGVAKHAGDVEAVFKRIKPVEARYTVQMLAHATLEPQNCVARVGPNGVDVWASTQFPGGAHPAAAQAAGVKPEDVRIHAQFLGGGFGRRLDFDFVPQAVAIAKALPGTPVKLIWSREEDTTHDFYRPPSVHIMRAALEGGRLVALAHTMISPSITQRMFPGAIKEDGIDDFMVEGTKNLTYEIPHLDMRTMIQDIGIRVGYWRSVSNAHNAWAIESFVDELAFATKQDPVAFRLAMLQRVPRQRAALERAVRDARYAAKPAPGRAFGVASMECYNTHVAVVAEISRAGDKVKLERLTCAADCGICVHPDQAVAQLEGGMVTGLINALRAKITVKGGRVEQTNFHNFPLPRITDVPPLTVAIIPSTQNVGGLGEVGVPLVAPAIGNAIFALTGKRIRALPLEDGGISFA
jgi:CO/xanthine dehydrogenase Mo-binding subunit